MTNVAMQEWKFSCSLMKYGMFGRAQLFLTVGEYNHKIVSKCLLLLRMFGLKNPFRYMPLKLQNYVIYLLKSSFCMDGMIQNTICSMTYNNTCYFLR